MEPTVIALIGSAFGAVALKLTDHFLSKEEKDSNEGTRIRDELRLQIADQRTDIERLEKEVDHWKEMYFDLRQTHLDVQSELLLNLKKLKDGITDDNDDRSEPAD